MAPTVKSNGRSSPACVRLLICLVLTVGLAVGSAAAAPPSAVAAAPSGAISWTVDHTTKTINVVARLQIYSACSGSPGFMGTVSCARGLTSQVTQFLADKIKQKIEAVWNKPYRFRCYKLVFNVDVKLAASHDAVEVDRIGVRIDPSAGGIRDYVRATVDKSRYKSDDPVDRIDPINDPDAPTTWSETSQLDRWTYAHEFGHLIGLHDAYRDVVDPRTGQLVSQPYPDAPRDLMSTGAPMLAQETIDRLAKRNLTRMVDARGKPVRLEDLNCEYIVSMTGSGTITSMPVSHELRYQMPEATISWSGNDFRGSATVNTTGSVNMRRCTITFSETGTPIEIIARLEERSTGPELVLSAVTTGAGSFTATACRGGIPPSVAGGYAHTMLSAMGSVRTPADGGTVTATGSAYGLAVSIAVSVRPARP